MGEKGNLSPKEYEILKLFLKNKNVVLSRERIIADVWGNNTNATFRIIDTHIKKLREKLDSHAITTVRGYGYMWSE